MNSNNEYPKCQYFIISEKRKCGMTVLPPETRFCQLCLTKKLSFIQDSNGNCNIIHPVGYTSFYDPAGYTSFYDPVGYTSFYDPVGYTSFYDLANIMRLNSN